MVILLTLVPFDRYNNQIFYDVFSQPLLFSIYPPGMNQKYCNIMLLVCLRRIYNVTEVVKAVVGSIVLVCALIRCALLHSVRGLNSRVSRWLEKFYLAWWSRNFTWLDDQEKSVGSKAMDSEAVLKIIEANSVGSTWRASAGHLGISLSTVIHHLHAKGKKISRGTDLWLMSAKYCKT